MDRLRFMVRHAYERTTGYRDLYKDVGMQPDDIQTWSDFRRLPTVSKELIRDNLDEFTVAGPAEYVTTGGSTGIPFGFYTTRDESDIELAFVHDFWSDFGWSSRQTTAVLRGSFVGAPSKVWQQDRFWRELHLSSYYLGEESLPQLREALRRFRPAHLQAYPSALHALCGFTDAARLGHSFQTIILASENVYSWQLEKIEQCFPESQIVSHYGQAERVILAPWCAKSRVYHVLPLYGAAEILDENGREVGCGEQGRLVGTSFHMSRTPFIRYETLDLAVKGPDHCSECGRPSQMILEISGRAHEFIVTGRGRRISTTAINMHDDTFDGLRQFQFFQDTPGVVILKCLPRGPWSDSVESRIRRSLTPKLGDDVTLQLEPVPEIPRTPAGKHRFLDQRLQLDNGSLAPACSLEPAPVAPLANRGVATISNGSQASAKH